MRRQHVVEGAPSLLAPAREQMCTRRSGIDIICVANRYHAAECTTVAASTRHSAPRLRKHVCTGVQHADFSDLSCKSLRSRVQPSVQGRDKQRRRRRAPGGRACPCCAQNTDPVQISKPKAHSTYIQEKQSVPLGTTSSGGHARPQQCHTPAGTPPPAGPHLALQMLARSHKRSRAGAQPRPTPALHAACQRAGAGARSACV